MSERKNLVVPLRISNFGHKVSSNIAFCQDKSYVFVVDISHFNFRAPESTPTSFLKIVLTEYRQNNIIFVHFSVSNGGGGGPGIFFGRGVPKYTGGLKFLERKIGGPHKIFDDQNVGSHKMTTDSVW